MTTPSSSVPAVPEHLHGCVRCGARIPLTESMCEHCNPLGLKAPAASQAHGTAFLAIAGAVVALAVAGRVALAGIGPFESAVGAVTADTAGLRVAISVTNRGTSSGATTCRVLDPAFAGVTSTTAFVTSPVVDPGETRTFDALVTTLGTEVRPLDVECGR